MALGDIITRGTTQLAARRKAAKILREGPKPELDLTGYDLFDYSRLGRHHEGVPQETLPRKQGIGGRPTERMADLLGDDLVQRNMDLAIERGRPFIHWYDVSPFDQAFLDANPDPEALRRFYGYQALASQRNSPRPQLKLGSWLWTQGENGLLTPDADFWVPQGYGAKAQKQIFQGAKDFANNGGVIDPLEAAKRASYLANWQGNYVPGTMDTHAVRLPAMSSGDSRWLLRDHRENVAPAGQPKVFETLHPRAMVESGDMTLGDAVSRPAFWESAPQGSEYGFFENGIWGPAAERAGLELPQAQAAGWIGGGHLTGLKGEAKLFLQSLEDRIRATAEARGVSVMQVIRDLANARLGSHFRTMAPMAAAGGLGAAAMSPEDSFAAAQQAQNQAQMTHQPKAEPNPAVEMVSQGLGELFNPASYLPVSMMPRELDDPNQMVFDQTTGKWTLPR